MDGINEFASLVILIQKPYMSFNGTHSLNRHPIYYFLTKQVLLAFVHLQFLSLEFSNAITFLSTHSTDT